MTYHTVYYTIYLNIFILGDIVINIIKYIRIDNEQRRAAIDHGQLFAAYLDALRDRRQYRGGMSWQKVGDKEYLVRSEGNSIKKSLGPRSPETEQVLSDFAQKKHAIEERLSGLKDRLNRQSAICRAMNLGRVSRLTGDILRALANAGLGHKTTMIIGTNALYAYESMAGVHFDSDLLATNDLDVLWDARSKLKLAAQVPGEGLIAILKKVDKSFEVMRSAKFRAVNKNGFMVDLLREHVDMRTSPEPSFAMQDDFVAVEINMKWLLSSPKVSATAIDEAGYPVPMTVPDPRSFAMHKLWVSRQVDRDPVKKPRDEAQAMALINLIENELPQYAFSEQAVRMFPKSVIRRSDAQHHFMGMNDDFS
ncbi:MULTISPECIES: GSU2403 family nucleotidyltransferase fold protein [Acidithiobacillus]|uniref:GSU2403 family nucleotidyltransferase fold protein n=1 Tax=Acidithiobacillus TaxID=119977 RepID=UPI00068FF741|nr:MULTISPECIES: nucleotidyltransferase domain-containing protein [Acidithiobacillus]